MWGVRRIIMPFHNLLGRCTHRDYSECRDLRPPDAAQVIVTAQAIVAPRIVVTSGRPVKQFCNHLTGLGAAAQRL